MRRVLKGFIGLVLVAGLAAGAIYVEQQLGAGETPDLTVVSTTFGDWVVKCVRKENGLPCEMSQQLIDGKSGNTVTRFSVVWSPTESRHALQVSVPLGVWLEPGAVLSVGELKVEGIQYSRCLPRGCMIEALLEDPMLAALKSGEKGQLTIFDRTHRAINLPFSLRGFASAETRLRKDTKAMSEKPFSFTRAAARTMDVVSSWFQSEEESNSAANIIEMEG